MRMRTRKNMRVPEICSIPGCGLKGYAKNLCKNHWSILRNRRVKGQTLDVTWDLRRKNYGQKCSVPDCLNVSFVKGLCQRHYSRFLYRCKKGYPSDLESLKIRLWGLREPRFLYKNHTLMKRNRLIKLKSANYICEECKIAEATEIHHKDGTKTNHDLQNLEAVCHKCHLGVCHKGHRTRPKLFRIYSLRVVSEKTKIPVSFLFKYAHNKGGLELTKSKEIKTALSELGIGNSENN